ncbi:MAG TPA: hypothetical protein VFN38_03685 [Gemmatimonadaceae bacterium]|nr:hypothetical protein [Gemmatimonadaceae bacterium]
MSSIYMHRIVGQLILGAGVALVMMLLRRLAPVKQFVVTADERERYEDRKGQIILASFAFVTLFTIAFFFCLRALLSLLVRRRSGAVLILEPIPELYWLIALFLAFLAASRPTSWWVRHALRLDSDRVKRYFELRYHFDTSKLGRIFAWTIVSAAVVSFAAGVSKTDQLTTQGIVIGEAFVANPPVRPYNTIRTIRYGEFSFQTRRGTWRQRKWFVVTFDDGTRWGYRTVLWDSQDPMLLRTVLELVSARSGRPIEQVEPFQVSR